MKLDKILAALRIEMNENQNEYCAEIIDLITDKPTLVNNLLLFVREMEKDEKSKVISDLSQRFNDFRKRNPIEKFENNFKELEKAIFELDKSEFLPLNFFENPETKWEDDLEFRELAERNGERF